MLIFKNLLCNRTFTSSAFIIALFFFILTFSIALPIYLRPFYYIHIDKMKLAEKSGFTEQEIREAYDNVLDYLTLSDKEFSTGVMAHSSEGAAHFADCKTLFSLNKSVLLGSAAMLLVLLLLRKHGKVHQFCLRNHSSGFWAAILAVAVPLVIGGLAAIDFDYAFVLFHKIFFPGKDNWVFDYRTDEIIRVLPQDFFMNCAILIGASIVIFAAILIITELILTKRRKKD